MSKKTVGVLVVALALILTIIGCIPKTIPPLRGAYQSEHVNGYIIQMTFQPRDHSFVEYIDNREVDKGTYEEIEDGLYKINGEMQELEITLKSNNSFDLIVKKLNDGNPITFKNVDATPVYIGTEFEDIEEYKTLLE